MLFTDTYVLFYHTVLPVRLHVLSTGHDVRTCTSTVRVGSTVATSSARACSLSIWMPGTRQQPQTEHAVLLRRTVRSYGSSTSTGTVPYHVPYVVRVPYPPDVRTYCRHLSSLAVSAKQRRKPGVGGPVRTYGTSYSTYDHVAGIAVPHGIHGKALPVFVRLIANGDERTRAFA